MSAPGTFRDHSPLQRLRVQRTCRGHRGIATCNAALETTVCNQFDAVEEGLGNARGTAVLTGNRAQLDFASSHPGDLTTGRFLMVFNEAFTSAVATCEFFTVHQDLGLVPCRFTRMS
jgi:hypothetical protein